MTYATQQDLENRFGEDDIRQLADRDGDGVADAAIVTDALTDADETINTYLALQYDLPLSPVPAALVRIASAIAYCYLFKSDPPEGVRKDHDAAIGTLRDIAAGRARLDVAGDEPEPAGQVVMTDGPGRVFDRDTLKGF